MTKVHVHRYHLAPTALVPNSPRPLLYYPSVIPLAPYNNKSSGSSNDQSRTQCSASAAHELFHANGWRTRWIFRYGDTQDAHYHSGVHECMAVLSGEATIRFGLADGDVNSDDEATEIHSSNRREGHHQNAGNDRCHSGIEIRAKAGDVFVLPAGTTHKTFAATPRRGFALLTPGDGHHDLAEINLETAADGRKNLRQVLEGIDLDGFTMLGAYPRDGGRWDFCVGGENTGAFEHVWSVARPEKDPVLGLDHAGLVGLWT